MAKTLQAIKWYFLLTVPKEETEPSDDQVWLTYTYTPLTPFSSCTAVH